MVVVSDEATDVISFTPLNISIVLPGFISVAGGGVMVGGTGANGLVQLVSANISMHAGKKEGIFIVFLLSYFYHLCQLITYFSKRSLCSAIH